MNKRIFHFFTLVLALITLGLIFLSTAAPTTANSPKIIATNFIAYDLARAVTNDEENLKMLLPPASEAHSFEPTPADLLTIESSDLFIYIGGESDAWVEDFLKDNDIPEEKTLRLMDFVELKAEAESPESETKDPEYDEHIWTSPKNTIKLTDAIKEKLKALYPDQAETYEKSAAAYISELKNLDHDFRDLVETSPKKPLIFADRFPFRYFVDEYGLDYVAAFPGCSDQTEADPATIAKLIKKVQSDDIKVILKLELTSDKLARAISDETGAEIHTFFAGHNISKQDFDAKKTYLDLLHENLTTLREALK